MIGILQKARKVGPIATKRNQTTQTPPYSKTGGWGFESLHSCQAKPSRRRFIRIAGAAPFLVLGGLRAWSQASRSIKFVVPFPPPGGAADLLVRVLAQQVGTAGGVTTG